MFIVHGDNRKCKQGIVFKASYNAGVLNLELHKKQQTVDSRQLEHFQCSCNASIVLSHPRRKNKNAPRVGHPNLTLTLKKL